MPMDQRAVAAGTVIYSEGEASDSVYFIRSGRVEITKHAEDTLIRLVTLGKGQVLGEMSVIRNEAHSTTASALTDTTLLTLGKKEFLSAFGGPDGLALRILRMLCERLAKADEQLLADAEGADPSPLPARRDDIAQIRLLGDSDLVRTQIGAEGISVDALPFRVGRHRQAAKAAAYGKDGVNLRAPNNYQLSPQHFAIQAEGDHLVVHDLGSQLGTSVNGSRISQFDRDTAAELHFGLNTVIAGGADSPYRFNILVEPAKDEVNDDVDAGADAVA